MIRKLPSGKYRLYSLSLSKKTGKRKILGTFNTREDANKRERQIQYFKHLRGNPVRKGGIYQSGRTKRNPTDEKIIKAFKVLIHKYKTLYSKIKYRNKEKECKTIIEYYMLFLEGLRHDILRISDPNLKFHPYYGDMDVIKKYGFSNVTMMDTAFDNIINDINRAGSLVFSYPTASDKRTISQKLERVEELYELLALNYKYFENEVKNCI